MPTYGLDDDGIGYSYELDPGIYAFTIDPEKGFQVWDATLECKKYTNDWFELSVASEVHATCLADLTITPLETTPLKVVDVDKGARTITLESVQQEFNRLMCSAMKERLERAEDLIKQGLVTRSPFIGVIKMDQGGNIRDVSYESSCEHTWKPYVGLTQAYDYCTKCDAKRS